MPESSTVPAYQAFAKQKGFVPKETEFPGGAKGFWIGDQSVHDILIYFVGGGYVVALTPGHFEFCWQTKQNISRHHHDITILVVQYTLAPQAVYPRQLVECIEVVRYVMTTLGKSSSNIILGGDSAGAALALNIIAHAKHPHPAIESLVPKTPYRGLLLISPWVDFRTNDESWKQNGNKDMCVPKTFKAWSEAYLGGAPEDSYSTPGRAAADWWKGLQVGKVLVTAGAEECLLDSAKTLANNIEAYHPQTQLIVGNGECHVAPISSFNFGETEKGEQALAIDSWLASCF
ncbi:hypothetical protein MMC28_009271 [Mycoblastus sanguinarius]|nr:hypothetical protein [Mycoblastus sanguinarius]